MKLLVWSLVSIVIMIIVWQIYALTVGNDYILPKPTSVVESLVVLLIEPSTYVIIYHSLFRLFVSVMLAGSIGMLLGLMAGDFKWLDAFFRPWVTSFRSLPVASVIVIILILFSRTLSLYIITFLILFPLVYEATKQGVLNLDHNLKDALKLEPVHFIYKTFSIHLPSAMPYIKTAALQSVGLGFKVLVMAEFISQQENSIGRALYVNSITVRYSNVFAWTMIIIFIVAVFEISIRLIKPN